MPAGCVWPPPAPTRSGPAGAELVDEVVAYLQAQPDVPDGPADPGGGRPHTNRILVPVGGGKSFEPACAALDAAAELALAISGDVRVLHIRERDACRSVRFYAESPTEAATLVNEAVRRVRLRGAAATGVIRNASGFRVAETIVLDAAQSEARAVVIGARRRHGLLPGMLLGSISLAVARRAPCPVMIVHPAWSDGGQPPWLGGPRVSSQRRPTA